MSETSATLNRTTPAVPAPTAGHLNPSQRAWRRFRRNRPAMISVFFLASIALFTLGWPLMSSYSATALSDAQFAPPGPKHWCGTDVHGRDLLVRMARGAQISLVVGAVGAFVSLVIGVTWGAVAGYVGGRIDALLMRLVDILYTIPPILFAIVLIATMEGLLKDRLVKAFGPDFASAARLTFLFIGLGAVSWLTMARIVRGQVLSLRHRPFIDACRSLGATHARIVWRHILPNMLGLIIVYLTLTVPSVILYESFLSYLGLGIQPPLASWGTLIAEGAGQLNPIRIYWWLLVFPAGMLVSTLLALNFLGDGLRDAWDPKGARN